MKFLEGNPETALAAPNAVVLTRRYADIIFGSSGAAMDRPLSMSSFGMEINFVVSGVVEELPKNTHFNFDMMGAMQAIPLLNEAGGMEFYTYYLIQKTTAMQTVRTDIENTYCAITKPWGERVGLPDAHGLTETIGDIHLKSKASGASDGMRFIYILTGLAFFVLILAVTNFINLFMTQGEMRMQEIGIRKSNGAQIMDIVRQFFKEVAIIVGIAFAIGLLLAILFAPYFGELIRKEIDLGQLLNPMFIASGLLLFVVTVVLSAFYPALYLSRFSPLEILGKRIRFSKRRLTAGTVIFQSIVSIVLLSVILILYKQTFHLQNLPLGYNPKNVMSVMGNGKINSSYQAVKQELSKYPEIKAVSGSNHIFGRGTSGESIAYWGKDDQHKPIASYRLLQGMPELMELELIEGRFWQESDPDSIRAIILNEAAVKMLGGESPIEKMYSYNGPAQVIGVVKDFFYDDPGAAIAPIALSRITNPTCFNIRFNENVNTIHARQIVSDVFKQFDPDFALNPIWSVDVYQNKFREIKTLTRTVFIGSAVSIFVAMLGLLAIHLYSAVRRTKEIGIRRVFGAEKTSVFLLLSLDVLKWIVIAALFAIPVAVYFVSQMLNNYANRVHLNWTIFVFPILIQCVIAILTTSGVTLSVLSQNPVKSIKSE